MNEKNLKKNDSSFLCSKRIKKGRHLKRSRRSSPCFVNSTNNSTSFKSTNVLCNGTANGTNITRNCSNYSCSVNSTNNATINIKSTNALPNGTVNEMNITRNCNTSHFCSVNSTHNSTSINSTSLPSNATDNATTVTKNCVSNRCQVNMTNNLTSSDLILAYKTEFFAFVSLPLFTKANFAVLFTKMDELPTQCSFDAGDGSSLASGKTNETSLNFSHVYRSHGDFRVRIQCVGNISTQFDVSRRVFVFLPAVVQGLRCPDVVPTNKTVSCSFNVVQATQLFVKVNIGDSMETSYNISGKL